MFFIRKPVLFICNNMVLSKTTDTFIYCKKMCIKKFKDLKKLFINIICSNLSYCLKKFHFIFFT